MEVIEKTWKHSLDAAGEVGNGKGLEKRVSRLKKRLKENAACVYFQ